MSKEGFLSKAEHTGLVLCSDGVPVFKSSKGSLWPVYLMVTSLPPQQRVRAENLIVAGLWHGHTKPEMDVILQPILDDISSLKKNGIIVESGASVRLRPMLLMAIFDLPAKASATNTKQFNGEYGCFYCLDKGEVCNRARIYPPNTDCTLRNHEQMREQVLTAERTGTIQCGIKGDCVLAKHIEFPQCIPIDYMHSILEGVFKQLMKRWFNPKFHSEPYSLRKHIPQINRLVCNIKPINDIQRLPRSLDSMSFFKASEFRAWLLFYSLPVLSEFLPAEYTHHLSLLVEALHLLLSDCIKIEDFDSAQRMLNIFYEAAGNLYGRNIYTANMHSLVHTVPLAKLWGPLWSYSMFGFENLNGYIGTAFHGTRRIVFQMSLNIQLLQTLPNKLMELSRNESSQTQEYVKSMFNRYNNMVDIGYQCHALGKMKLHSFTSSELSAISLSEIQLPSTPTAQSFQRLMKNNTIYYSSSSLRSSCRDNTICTYLGRDECTGIGKILSFNIVRNTIPFCFLQPLRILSDSPISHIRPPRNKAISHLNSNSLLSRHIILAGPSPVDVIAISVPKILKKCLRIQIKMAASQCRTYCVVQPNPFELH